MDQSGDLRSAAREALRDEPGEALELILGGVLAGAEPDALDAMGDALVARGVGTAEAARIALACARVLEARDEAEGVDARLIALVRAVEQARRRRRQAWISFLVHELKNPLNTIVNAIWLLREKAAMGQAGGRFLELAERAVRRLEARVTDLRELDEALLIPPPGWEQREPPPRAPGG